MSESLRKQFAGRAAALLPYLDDPAVTDVLVNGTHSLYVERSGALVAQPSPFGDRREVMELVERLLVPLGKRVDAAVPYLDGRLADGSRFHVILSPIAVEGPLVSIRKLRNAALCPLESFGPPDVTGWLVDQVRAGRNLLFCGGTGSGKTTLLTRLLDLVPEAERIVVIEETVEIAPRHPHVLHLESRLPTPDGAGEVTLRALVRNALRMRPDRLVLGECRGAEAFDLLQAMNTGHAGSFSTIHANGALDALRRLESLTLLAGFLVPSRTVREWIGATIHAVVHLERCGAARQIREIVQVQGLEGEIYRITPKLQRKRGLASFERLCESRPL